MIYFVRHGETDYNLKGICAGQTDIALNATGLKQAQTVAEALKGIPFDECYCSPLKRARQTCAAILFYHPGLKPVFDERIKERNCGKAEGQPRSATPIRSWRISGDEAEMKKLGIETISELVYRVSGFYDELKTKSGKNILVVAHGWVGKATHVYFCGEPADGDLDKIQFPNVTVKKFSYSNNL